MKNFDVFRTEDGSVSKYIHEDGSETAIKLVKSLQNILNPITNTIETRASERNKYSIFISSSVGCYMKCKFCHLTLKEAEYIKIDENAVLENLKEAMEDMVIFNPDLKNRYIKLSWMGIPTEVTLPNGFIQRFEDNKDVNGSREKVFQQIESGALNIQIKLNEENKATQVSNKPKM